MDILEVSPRDYHSRLRFNRDDIFDRDSYLSKSVLWSSFGISLWHWRNHLERKMTTAMQWGSVIDCLTTTPEEAGELIISKQDCPYLSRSGGYGSKQAREWRNEHLEAGRFILTGEEMERAHEHAAILLNEHPVSSRMFAESKKQVILHCKNQDGINLKALADLVPRSDYLVDLKMCSDFSLAGFGRACAKFGYHVQAGLYLIIWNNMHPDDERRRFKHIWQNPATGEVAVTEMSLDDILTGQAVAKYLLNRLTVAYKTGFFPMLTDAETPVISRPAWAGMEDEMMLEGVEVLQIGREVW